MSYTDYSLQRLNKEILSYYALDIIVKYNNQSNTKVCKNSIFCTEKNTYYLL